LFSSGYPYHSHTIPVPYPYLMAKVPPRRGFGVPPVGPARNSRDSSAVGTQRTLAEMWSQAPAVETQPTQVGIHSGGAVINVTSTGSGAVTVTIAGVVGTNNNVIHHVEPSGPVLPVAEPSIAAIASATAARLSRGVDFRAQQARAKAAKRKKKEDSRKKRKIVEGGEGVDVPEGAKKSGKGGRRPRYTEDQKRRCLDMLDRVGGVLSVAVRNIKAAYSGFETLHHNRLAKWRENMKKIGKATMPNLGRPLCTTAAFDAEVFDQLVYQVVVQNSQDNELSATTVANVCYTYSMLRDAVIFVRSQAKWAGDAKIQKLTMSNEWCCDFLARCNLKRRKVSTKVHLRGPDDAEVQRVLSEIQAASAGIPLQLRINMDETGICPSGATHQFIAEDQDRAATADFGNKDRVTAVVAASAAGEFLPMAFIIKCAATKKGRIAGADQSQVRVLKDLLKQKEFAPSRGWHHTFWIRNRTVTIGHGAKAEVITVTYKRAVLVNRNTGVIVMAQTKAWADSAAIEMWVDLVLVPYVTKIRRELSLPADGKAILVWDNAPAHKDVAAFGSNHISMKFLPPNCTSELQVCMFLQQVLE